MGSDDEEVPVLLEASEAHVENKNDKRVPITIVTGTDYDI
jgi:hypothetical protein